MTDAEFIATYLEAHSDWVVYWYSLVVSSGTQYFPNMEMLLEHVQGWEVRHSVLPSPYTLSA